MNSSEACPAQPNGESIRQTTAAIWTTVFAVLPVFLFAGMAVLMRKDLKFDESGLGGAVAAFFLASAIASFPGGRLSDRFGPDRVARLSAYLTSGTLLAIGWWANNWRTLVVLLFVGGIANGLAHPAVNLMLATRVPRARQGLAFGLKQAAAPGAMVLAGAALPLIGLRLGWQHAFTGTAIIGILVRSLLDLNLPSSGAESVTPPIMRIVVTRRLLVLSIAAGAGAGAAGSMGAFLVDSAMARGVASGQAGALLAIGGSAGIASRLLTGWLADLRSGNHFVVISMMMLAGSVGLLMFAAAPDTWIVLATVLGFGSGWGWAGLFNFAIVADYRSTPGAATGVTQTGVFAGGVVGPLAFGLTVVHASYAVAWALAALASIGAAALTWLSKEEEGFKLLRSGA